MNGLTTNLDPPTAELLRHVEAAARQASTSTTASDREAAERYLVDFRQHARQPSILLQLLYSSTYPPAAMHIATAIKASALAEWSKYDAALRTELPNELLKYAVHRLQQSSSTDDRYVLNTVLQCTAVIYKRGWFDSSNQQTTNASKVLEAIRGLTQDTAAPLPLRQLGVDLAINLCTEMSVVTASSIGTSWDFHVRCHRSFESETLQPLVQLMCQLLAQLQPSLRSQPTTPLQLLMSHAVNALELILTFEYDERSGRSDLNVRSLQLLHYAGSVAKGQSTSMTGQPKHKATAIRPGPNWTDVYVQSQLVELLLTVYSDIAALGQQSDGWLVALGQVRQCLINLASLSGSIFTSEQQAASYAQRLFHALNVIVSSLHLPSLDASSDQQLLDDCDWEATLDVAQAYSRLLLNIPATVLNLLPHNQLQQVFEQLTKLTSFTIEATALNSDSMLTAPIESLQHLLEGFSTLIDGITASSDALSSPAPQPITSVLSQCSGHLFSLYVTSHLQAMQRASTDGSADSDLDTDETALAYSGESVYDALASLGRAHIQHVVPLLTQRIQQCVQQWQSYIQQCGFNPNAASNTSIPTDRLFDELELLIHLLTRVVTDDVEGELPVMPQAVQQLLFRANTAQADALPHVECINAVAAIIRTNSQIATYIRQQQLSIEQVHTLHMFSPLIARTTARSLRRWVAAYLMKSDEDIMQQIKPRADSKQATLVASALTEPFTARSPASVELLEMMVGSVAEALTVFAAEEALSEANVQLLLYMALYNASIRTTLSHTASWNQLMAVYNATAPLSPYATLEPKSTALIEAAAVHLSTLPTSQIKQFTQAISLVVCDSSRLAGTAQSTAQRTQSLHSALHSVVQVPAQRLSSVMSSPTFQQAAVSGNIALEEHLLVSLAMLRGLATFIDNETYETSFPALKQLFAPLMQLLELFGSSVLNSNANTSALATYSSSTLTVVTAIIKVFRDVAEAQISYLQPTDATQLVQTCVQLVQLYASINTSRFAALAAKTAPASVNKSTANGTRRKDEKRTSVHQRVATPHHLSNIDVEVLEESVWHDVTALLELMQFLLHAEDAAADQAVDACLLALAALQPILTTHLLSLPNVPELYYQLFQSVVATHAQHLMTLSPQHRELVLSTVNPALRHFNPTVARCGYKLVQDLTEFYHKSVQHADQRLSNGISPKVVVSAADVRAIFETTVQQWMIGILEQMLFAPIAAELMDSVSDALLPLLVVNLEHYNNLVAQAVAEWSSRQRAAGTASTSEIESNAERLRQSFHTLTSSNGVRAEVDRPNRLKLRNNLRIFLADTRAITYYR